jgi:hypothetical protein
MRRSSFALLAVYSMVALAAACSTEVITKPFDPITPESTGTTAPTTRPTATSTAKEGPDAQAPIVDSGPEAANVTIENATYTAASANETVPKFLLAKYTVRFTLTNSGGASTGFTSLAFDFGGKTVSFSAPCNGFAQPEKSSQTIQMTLQQSTSNASHSLECPSGTISGGNISGTLPTTFDGPLGIKLTGKDANGKTIEIKQNATKQ